MCEYFVFKIISFIYASLLTTTVTSQLNDSRVADILSSVEKRCRDFAHIE